MLELVALATHRPAGPASSRAASGSASPWRAPSCSRPEVPAARRAPRRLDLSSASGCRVSQGTCRRKVGITFVFVTHDQDEALGIADRVAVFRPGPDRADRHGRGGVFDRPGHRLRGRLVGQLQHRRLRHRTSGCSACRRVRAAPRRIGVDAPVEVIVGTVVAMQYHRAGTRLEVALDVGRFWSSTAPMTVRASRLRTGERMPASARRLGDPAVARARR